jgi:hypothetical protein
MVSSYWPNFAALRLFGETMPIYKAVATGNRNNLALVLVQRLHTVERGVVGQRPVHKGVGVVTEIIIFFSPVCCGTVITVPGSDF